MYIETHHADASLSSVCCDEWNLRSSLPTTTDVRKRLSHKIRPPALPRRTNKRCCKDMDYFRKKQEKPYFSFDSHNLNARIRHCIFPDFVDSRTSTREEQPLYFKFFNFATTLPPNSVKRPV